jgi:hypothetical protein
VDEPLIIGNTLEETAYHEAGHIVVAVALGLDLRPKGITIWEVTKNVMEGLAGYWDDDTDWEKNLQAVRAGQIAQWRKFPRPVCRHPLSRYQSLSNLSYSTPVRFKVLWTWHRRRSRNEGQGRKSCEKAQMLRH